MKSFSEFQEAALAIPAAAGVISKVLPAAAAITGAVGTYMQATKKDDDIIKPKSGEVKKTKKLIDIYKKTGKKIKPKEGEVTKQRELLSKAEKEITKPKIGEKQDAKKVVNTFKKVRKIEGKTMMRNKEDMEILKKGPGDLVPDAKKTYLRKLLDNLRKEEVMAAPTNNASSGAIAGLPPDDPPVRKNKRGSGMKNRKKKTYAYGGYGSRKNWMV